MAADVVAEALRLDCLRVWEGVSFQEQLSECFGLQPCGSEEWQWERTARIKNMASVMPDSFNGRVTASTLRNGMAPCSLRQSARCAKQHCSVAHVRATVFRSGHVCGGRHTAMDCLDKRRLTIEQAEDVAPCGGSPSVREEPAIAAAAAEARPSKRARGEDQPTAASEASSKERPRGGLRPLGYGECSGGAGYCWHGCERAAGASHADLRDPMWWATFLGLLADCEQQASFWAHRDADQFHG